MLHQGVPVQQDPPHASYRNLTRTWQHSTMAARPPSVNTGPAFAPRVVPLGDSAVMAELAETFDLDANDLAQRIAARIRAQAPDWIADVVPAIVSVTVHFAASTAEEARARRAQASRMLDAALATAPGSRLQADAPRHTIDIPVCYAPPFALDLDEVAQRAGVSADEVVRLHVAGSHRVLMIGFVPGQPYIGGLDSRLWVPRRANPRQRLERGTVAIANGQTVIYPFATPGGWNVIGRTALALFDPSSEPPCLLQAGDDVRFVPTDCDTFERSAWQ